MQGPATEWCFYWTVQRNYYFDNYINAFNKNDSSVFIEYYLSMIQLCDRKLEELPSETYLSIDELETTKKNIIDILCKPEGVIKIGWPKKVTGIKRRTRSFIVSEENNNKKKLLNL